ncbi:MAG: DHH family phosphoesterase [Candidatus Woesearchaeota archaeon]
MEFLESVENAVKEFNNLEKRTVRIIGHLDADGISSTSILISALKRENIKFNVSIIKQVDQNILDELKKEEYSTIFFVDLGSGNLDMIEKTLNSKTIFVLDHHKPEDVKTNLIHVNPHLYNIDGDIELSGAGVVYFFVRKLNERNKDLAYLAVIGAIGDMQESKGFVGLNNEVLKDAIQSRKIEVKDGLRMFGVQTKPIHKVLEYSTDPYVPGVTGNERGAIRFLEEIGIELKENGKYKKLIHLNQDDTKKLVTGIILRRLGSEDKPEDVLGPIYLLTNEEEENPTKDAREFATLLNACGRLNKPSLGIGTCLENAGIKAKAINLLIDYKKEIINSLNWFYSHRNTGDIIEKKGYIIINAEDNIRDTLIGTLASIISKSNLYVNGTIILALAHTLEEDTKVSARICGNSNIDVREIINDILKVTGGIGGGHKGAGGCLILQEKEEEFIKTAEKILGKIAIEEEIK